MDAGPDGDPFNWSVEQVVSFFCDSFRESSTDPLVLANTLRENDISGDILLTELTKDSLKNELAIQSFGLRAKITRAIETLRKSSAKYAQNRSDEPIPSGLQSHTIPSSNRQSLTPLPHHPHLQYSTNAVEPLAPTTPQSIHPISATVDLKHNVLSPASRIVSDSTWSRTSHAESLGATRTAPEKLEDRDHNDAPDDTIRRPSPTLRDNEEYSLGPDGRKRRRLDLTKKNSLEPRKTSKKVKKTASRYLPPEKSTLAQLFYDDFDDSDDDTFVLFGNQAPMGERRFVHRAMRRFHMAQPRAVKDRNGQDALAVFPYNFQHLPPHAPEFFTLYSKQDGEVSATKESAVDWPELSLSQDEYAYLLAKYPPDANQEQHLPAYGESDSEGYDSETMREIEEDRANAETSAKSKTLPPQEVDSVISECIENLREQWRTSKRAREEQKSRGLWIRCNKAGQVKDFMKYARGEVHRLNLRLKSLREAIKETPWSDRQPVIKQCQSLETTVFQQELNNYQIGVLQSEVCPPESATPVAPRKKHRQRRTNDDEESLSSEDELADFIVDDEVPQPTQKTSLNLAQQLFGSEDGSQSSKKTTDPEESGKGSDITSTNRAATAAPAEDAPVEAEHPMPNPVPSPKQPTPDAPMSDNRAEARPLSTQHLVAQFEGHSSPEPDVEFFGEPEHPVDTSTPPDTRQKPRLSTQHLVAQFEGDDTENDALLATFLGPKEKPAEEQTDKVKTGKKKNKQQSKSPRKERISLGIDPDIEVVDLTLDSPDIADQELLTPPLNPTDPDASESTKSPNQEDDIVMAEPAIEPSATALNGNSDDDDIVSPNPVNKKPLSTTEETRLRLLSIFQNVRPDNAQPPTSMSSLPTSPIKPSPITASAPPRTPRVKQEEDRSESPSPYSLPNAEDVELVARATTAEIESQNDSKSVLIKLVTRLTLEQQEKLLSIIPSPKSKRLRQMTWKALKALREGHTRIASLTPEQNEVYMRASVFFISWVTCQMTYCNKEISRASVDEALADKALLKPFYAQLLRALRCNIDRITTAKDVDDDDNQSVEAEEAAPAPSENTRAPHQKRKRKVNENREAIITQKHAHHRVVLQAAQEKQHAETLARSGVSNNDPEHQAVSFDPPVIYLHPYIGKIVKPHQLRGIQFMFRELVLDEKRQGCLLAHTMGLGKTMQVIAFLVTIACAGSSSDEAVREKIPEALRRSRTLVLCPSSLVENWSDEFSAWVPPDSRVQHALGGIIKIITGMTAWERLAAISDWYKEGGVLLLSYDLFREYIHNKNGRLAGQVHAEVKKQLLEGPNVIVADEAHKMRNRRTGLATACSQFVSKSRIALTGSPLANNLTDYFSMIDWIAPGYLGDFVQFKAKYVEPIEEGLYVDSTAREKRLSLRKLAVLKKDLGPKVNRADISVIEDSLPPKVEFVITIPLTNLQRQAYEIYVDAVLEERNDQIAIAKLWDWLAILSLLCNHPACFEKRLQDRNVTVETKGGAESDNEKPLGEENINQMLSSSVISRFQSLFKSVENIKSLEHSYRALIVDQIVRESLAIGDKVLIFSHSIPTLDYLEALLKEKGYSYSRLDGKTPILSRQAATKNFNLQSSSHVFLISMRAGGLGLNIPGANRVIIFDFSFNPTWEEQAVGRAYRFGQKKAVYVYRFITGGTYEDIVYNKTVFKTQLSSRVVDKKAPIRYASKSVKDYLFKPRDVEQDDVLQFKGKDPSAMDKILDSDHAIRKITLMETFQREDNDKLTPEEEQVVQAEVADERLKRDDPDEWARRNTAQLIEQARNTQYNTSFQNDGAYTYGYMSNLNPMYFARGMPNSLGNLPAAGSFPPPLAPDLSISNGASVPAPDTAFPASFLPTTRPASPKFTIVSAPPQPSHPIDLVSGGEETPRTANMPNRPSLPQPTPQQSGAHNTDTPAASATADASVPHVPRPEQFSSKDISRPENEQAQQQPSEESPPRPEHQDASGPENEQTHGQPSERQTLPDPEHTEVSGPEAQQQQQQQQQQERQAREGSAVKDHNVDAANVKPKQPDQAIRRSYEQKHGPSCRQQ